jgi:hypothetical protein
MQTYTQNIQTQIHRIYIHTHTEYTYTHTEYTNTYTQNTQTQTHTHRIHKHMLYTHKLQTHNIQTHKEYVLCINRLTASATPSCSSVVRLQSLTTPNRTRLCCRSGLAILFQEDHNGNKSQTLVCVILRLFQVLRELVFFFKWSNEWTKLSTGQTNLIQLTEGLLISWQVESDVLVQGYGTKCVLLWVLGDWSWETLSCRIHSP